MGWMMLKYSRRTGRFRRMSRKAIEATNDHNLILKQFSNIDRHLMCRFYDWSHDDEEEAECGECGREDKRDHVCDPEWSVDDIEEPNVYPYKKCSVCSERSSCGNYNDNKEWVCENCAADEEDNDNGVACKRCGDTTCEEDSHYNCRLLWNSNKTGKQICRRCVGEEDKDEE